MCRHRMSADFVSSSKSTRFILRPVVRQLISNKVPDTSRKRPTRNRIDEESRPSVCIPCRNNPTTTTFRIMSHGIKPGILFASFRLLLQQTSLHIPRPKLKQEYKDASSSTRITSAGSCLTNNTPKTPQMYQITGK